MIAKPLFSSASDEWNTPQSIIDRVLVTLSVGEVDLDPCSNATSKVPARTKVMLPDDGLAVDWTKYSTIYVNLPYSQMAKWAIKIHEYSESGADSALIALVPARTDARWFHSMWSSLGCSVCLLRGRVRFERPGLALAGIGGPGGHVPPCFTESGHHGPINGPIPSLRFERSGLAPGAAPFPSALFLVTPAFNRTTHDRFEDNFSSLGIVV